METEINVEHMDPEEGQKLLDDFFENVTFDTLPDWHGMPDPEVEDEEDGPGDDDGEDDDDDE